MTLWLRRASTPGHCRIVLLHHTSQRHMNFTHLHGKTVSLAFLGYPSLNLDTYHLQAAARECPSESTSQRALALRVQANPLALGHHLGIAPLHSTAQLVGS